jgi:ribosomal protein L37E
MKNIKFQCGGCGRMYPSSTKKCPHCGVEKPKALLWNPYEESGRGIMPKFNENTIKIDLNVFGKTLDSKLERPRRKATKFGGGLAAVETLIAQGHSSHDVFDRYDYDEEYILKCDRCGKVEFMDVLKFDGIIRTGEKRLPICMHNDGRMHIIKKIDRTQRSAYLKKYEKWTGFYADLDRYHRVYGTSPNISIFNEIEKLEKDDKTWGPKHILWGTGFNAKLAQKWLNEGRIPKKLQPTVRRLIAMYRIGGF